MQDYLFSRNAKTLAKGVYMRSHKLSALLQALLFGTLASAAAAQTMVVPAPAPYTSDDQSVVVVQPAPATVIVDSPAVTTTPRSAVQPDPTGDVKCRFAAPSEYWDCVNSHNGGGGK
jgi:hypothetical protein